LFYARVERERVAMKLSKLNTKFPLQTVYFLEDRGMTTSSYIIYDYTT